MAHRHLLATTDMQTMADVGHAGLELSPDDIHAMGLIVIGGNDTVEPSETYWAVPTGERQAASHRDDCPVCHPPKTLDGIPF